MGLSSEQVHWLFGVFLALIVSPLILHDIQVFRRQRSALLIPCALLIVGIALLLDPMIHGSALPANYSKETDQHIFLSALLLSIGVIEGARCFGKLPALLWSMALPVGLFLAGIIFFFHAQHDTHVSMLLLIVQHRIMGVTLIIAAVTKAVAELRPQPGLHAAWLIVILVFSSELILYTEGGSIFDAFSVSTQ
ncbi:hypothetical protein [Nitrococcus mobilis]|uniref:Thymidylate synthase n=1 Tax=Nitrococcus mobilis Nb-231 TaxID=314278 RepID=A4BS78_9GAMM|nr:hypothetical protein [Nitrococcus mobilis]EAR21338.1 thymidylate synthase [Nitrococcus mobilis Nb-231]